MRSKTIFAAGMVLVLVIALFSRAAPTAQSTSTRWEYKFVLADSGKPEQSASKDDPTPNALGNEGWELVSATPKGDLRLWLIYKRPK